MQIALGTPALGAMTHAAAFTTNVTSGKAVYGGNVAGLQSGQAVATASIIRDGGVLQIVGADAGASGSQISKGAVRHRR